MGRIVREYGSTKSYTVDRDLNGHKNSLNLERPGIINVEYPGLILFLREKLKNDGLELKLVFLFSRTLISVARYDVRGLRTGRHVWTGAL
jgi:hypothetical protein